MELQAQETASLLDDERNAAAAQAQAAADQAAADAARLAQASAELEKYRSLEASFAERLKWAIKGKKQEE